MNRITHIILLVFSFCTLGVTQGLTYKEIKTIEKSIPCTNKNKLSITGERTYLKISSWNENYIKASINVISKFTNKDQASADLEKVNVVFEKSRKTIIYSNALRIKTPSDKPKSNITVTVDMRVPHGMKVDITNAFGEIEITGEYEMIESQSDFSEINIYDLSGSSDIRTKYGDISVDGYNGEMNIKADRSNIIMENVTGKMEVEASYGELEIFYPRRSAFYSVNTSYSPIALYIQEGFEEAIALTCKECSIMGNEDVLPLKTSMNGEDTNGMISNIKGKKPTSLISSEIENIKIKTYKSKSNTN
jgi:hypothetical protein